MPALPAPDTNYVHVDSADTDSNEATLSINMAFGNSSQPVTASLNCMALDGGSDRSWVLLRVTPHGDVATVLLNRHGTEIPLPVATPR